LRAAFDSLVKDPAFLKDAERAKAQIDPTSGADLQRDLVKLFKAPKDIVERAKAAMD
jgi:hypothetical protein